MGIGRSKIKILGLFTAIFSTGGIQKYNRTFLEALPHDGTEVIALSLNDKSGKPGMVPDDITIKCCGGAFILRQIKLAFYFFVYAIKFKPAVIFCGHINLSPVCLFGKMVFGVDYIIQTHGIEIWGVKNRLHLKALKNAKAILAVSKFSADRIKVYLPEAAGKIVIIPDSVDGARFYHKDKDKELVEKYKLANQRILLTLTRLDHTEANKGYDNIIRLIPGLLKEIPDIKYMIVGAGDDTERIKRLAKEFGIEDRVILAGYVPDEKLIDYYNLCDLFVLPSTKEGFGIVFLEALACGKPVIGGNKDGSVDALLNGELGILVDPHDMGAIKEAISGILKKEVQTNKLDSAYLRNKVLETYGSDKFKDKIKDLLKKYKYI